MTDAAKRARRLANIVDQLFQYDGREEAVEIIAQVLREAEEAAHVEERIAVAEMVAEEREACAKVADDEVIYCENYEPRWSTASAKRIAAAIRARAGKEGC